MRLWAARCQSSELKEGGVGQRGRLRHGRFAAARSATPPSSRAVEQSQRSHAHAKSSLRHTVAHTGKVTRSDPTPLKAHPVADSAPPLATNPRPPHCLGWCWLSDTGWLLLAGCCWLAACVGLWRWWKNGGLGRCVERGARRRRGLVARATTTERVLRGATSNRDSHRHGHCHEERRH